VRTLTRRELNRTLLARQLLLRRARISAPRAVARLVALQAQASVSPYVALWSRVEGFRKEQLTRALERGTVVKATSLRTTLHVSSRAAFPFVYAAYLESGRARTEGLGVDVETLRAAVPHEPLSGPELYELAYRVLGTDDRWTAAFALRALPFVRTAPLGEWPHHAPSPAVLWREPLPAAAEASARVVREYLAGYGPATRDDVEQFTGFKVRQIAPVLDGLPTFADERGRTLYDLPRARLVSAEAAAPVRFLPPYDSVILAHRDRSRILPDAYYETVIRRKNATTLATFTVDGFIAGAWRAERARGRWKLRLEPFEPLPQAVRAQVDAESARLLAFYESAG
jgi:Winged helix DNA-binding domain